MYKRFTIILTMWISVIAPAHAQWTEPVRISEPGVCWYPDIIAQGDTIHVVYTNIQGGDKISYVRSTDTGETWSTYRVLSDTINDAGTFDPRVLIDGDKLMVVWNVHLSQGVNRENIGYRISSDNGNTWSFESYIFDQNWWRPVPMVASSSDSVANIIMGTWLGDSVVYFNIRSTDFGQTWSDTARIFSVVQGGLFELAQYDTFVHFSWVGQLNPDLEWDTYYIRSTDAGITWSENIPLSEIDDYPSDYPSLCANGTQGVELTWMDFKYSPPGFTGDIFARSSDDQGSSWTPEVQITFRHKSTRSDIVGIADTLDVVWKDERPENGHFSIYFSKSTDGGQTWNQEERLDPDDLESHSPALAASNGRVYVVWGETRYSPDTSGIYFSRWQEEPVAIEGRPFNSVLDIISLSAYPNPFNSRVAISLNMLKGGEAEIAIYDVEGRLVKTIFKGGNLEKGTYKFTWDATDASGKAVSSGLYFAVAGTPQGKITKSLTLIR